MTEYAAKQPPAMAPSHPGAILREEVLPALGLTEPEAAKRLGISQQALRTILAERAPVSPRVADGIGRLCGNGAAFWLRLQAALDRHVA